jgi:tetratricopeptide (TPR) repeat protein
VGCRQAVPAWDAKTKEWVRQGKLVVLGITQEQHADRCRLLAQWRQLNWPILHDPINIMQVTGVPIEVAIDEYGIVRSLRPNLETLEQEFLNRKFTADRATRPGGPGEATEPDWVALRRVAEQEGSCQAWRDLGDALVLWAGPGGVDEAIHAYTQALHIKPDDGAAHFRLGVCYRTRSESQDPKPGDFQTAVDHWMTARSLRPDQYIWRRRIEQYGPRRTKPYPFYDWVPTANREIRARGDQPVELQPSPTGSEMAGPISGREADSDDGKPLDPEGRVARDIQGFVVAEVTVVPPKVKPGEAVRVYLTLRPNDTRQARWSDEGEPLQVWIDLPPGWRAQPQRLSATPADRPGRSQPLRVECDIGTSADATGTARLLARALYEVRGGEEETSRLLCQDIPITVAVGK